MTVTPLRPGATLRCSPVPLSDGARAPPRIILALAFKAAILVPPYPRHFWPPTHISKYDGETNLDHWLKDYHHAMRARGVG